MKAAARISSTGTRGRTAGVNINWSECFFCQDPKRTSKNNPLRKATQAGIDNLTESAKERQKYNDDTFIDTLESLQSIDISEHYEQIQWHKSCYSDFTHKKNLKNLKSRIQLSSIQLSSSLQDVQESEDEQGPSTSTSSHVHREKKTLRSSHGTMDWSKCAFCQTDIPGKGLTNVEFENTSTKMINLAQFDRTMRCRFAGVSDLMAAEGKYHLYCYVSFCRKYEKKTEAEKLHTPEDLCFVNAMTQLEKELKNGHVFTLKAIWEHYNNLLTEDLGVDGGVYRSNRFKERVQNYLGSDKVTFVQPLDAKKPLLVVPSLFTDIAMRTALKDLSEEEESSNEDDTVHHSLTHHEDEILSWIFRVAVKIHNDVKHTPGHDIIGGLTTDRAEKVVPESLYMLVNLLCTGDITEESDHNDQEEAENRNKVLSICQDIVYVSSRGRKMTPKHLGLGLSLHQATRSKELVNLFHAAGHSAGYETILRMDTAIANDIVQRYQEHGNVMIPRNFIRRTGKGYMRYSNDNIDIIEETLSGTGTFHASQYVALRRKEHQEQEMDIQIKMGSSKVLHAPPEITDLQDANMTTPKPEPVFVEPVLEHYYVPDHQKIKETTTLDLAWVLARQQQPNDQAVPGWNGFNQKVSTTDPPLTVVGPMPILNAPAHDFNTLWTVMQNCQAMTKTIGEKYTIITFDEQLYCKAKLLQWNKENCEDVVIMLGGFHAQLTFSKVIGKYMDSSGLENVWIESEVLGETTADNVMKGKGWNRIIRIHKLTLEALWSVLWPCFKAWTEDNGKVVNEKLEDAAKRVAEGFASKDDRSITSSFDDLLTEIEAVQVLFAEFEADCSENATFCYWRTYMKLVSILLRFTRALRGGDWQLFLTAFAEMLPWFGAFDHYHYTRWGAVFLADMKMLPMTAPEVHQGFLAGDFVTKETKQKFNEIPDDQAIEHVNKAGKVAGGLVGITRTDTARDRWSLTFNERAQLAKNTKTMFNFTASEQDDNEHEVAHKDFGKKRMKQDQDDVQKLIAMFKMYNPFDRTSSELVSLATGDVASVAVTNDLLSAEETGKKVVSQFVEGRLINKTTGFHDRIKTKNLQTFESMYTVQFKVGKEKAVALKADRNLLRRVVTAMQAGRDVNMNRLLEQELCAVPLSLATGDRRLRLPQNKADLGKLLRQDLPQNAAPAPHPTCTIVDGMAMIQTLGNRIGAKTLGEWTDGVAAYVTTLFSPSCTRVDLVFDRYNKNTIKSTARSKRADGKKAIRRPVQSRSQSIGQWDRFSSLDENKASLADFLCTELTKKFQDQQRQELVLGGGFTDPKQVWSSSGRDVSKLCSAEHEEADTRMILHAKEASEQGYPQTIIVSRDTDVLVLLLAHQQQLSLFLWMQAGTPRKQNFVPVHLINITDSQRASLLAFHAITGSDTTSQFAGIGKRSAWGVFVHNPQLLQNLGSEDFPDENVFADAESFVCKLYAPTTQSNSIHQVRCELFHGLNKPVENLPPTRDALTLHIRRSHFQTLVWRRALDAEPHLPAPVDSGWEMVEKDGIEVLQPQLMISEPATVFTLELTTCGCASCATRRCSCARSELGCTQACKCKGLCRNPWTAQAVPV